MIFYSEHCNTCRNIMSILKNDNLIQNFKTICVDTILDKLPPDMQVPLMRLVNVPEPLYAQSIYNWISQIKLMRKSNTTISSIVPKQTGPRCYDVDLMAKKSDGFAFADPNINDPLPQSYYGINQEENNVIYTPQDPKHFVIKKEEQKKMLGELESKRTQQNNEFVQYSSQMQMELLMKDEHDKQSGNYTPVINKPQPKKGITLIKR